MRLRRRLSLTLLAAAAAALPVADWALAPVAPDTAPPRLTAPRLVGHHAVRFSLSEDAQVTVTVAGEPAVPPIVVWGHARRGSVTIELQRTLARGRYAIHALAVDDAGNRSSPAVARRNLL
jgi:hypothetical protein